MCQQGDQQAGQGRSDQGGQGHRDRDLDGHAGQQQPAIQQGLRGNAGLEPFQRLLDQVDRDLQPGQLAGQTTQVLARRWPVRDQAGPEPPPHRRRERGEPSTEAAAMASVQEAWPVAPSSATRTVGEGTTRM